MKEEDHDERIGIFPSWNVLYLVVIVYTIILILLLYFLTITLDYSVSCRPWTGLFSSSISVAW